MKATYFFRFFLTGPYRLRAFASQAARLPLAFLRHAFRALASLWARVRTAGLQPVAVIFVVWLITAPFWPVTVVGVARFWPHNR
jgi:hypothetical protein